jgi:nitrate/TMAO reductase-like tetraheme cytochrome c subunit
MTTTTPRLILLALVWAGVLGLAAPAAAQLTQSRCADCHFARPDAPGQSHLAEWDRSPHGRNSVGCEKCHGGDASTVESFLAHRDILAPSNVKSPLHPRNIPATCGGCHVGPFVAFQDSRHHELLQKGEGQNRGPSCVTCHGEVDGRVLSPKGLESRCNSCHGPGEPVARADRARNARQTYEGLSVVREQLKLAANLIRRVSDKGRRAELEEMHRQAEVPMTRAVNAGHRFVYDELQSSLKLAQTRAEDLLARLANLPSGRP